MGALGAEEATKNFDKGTAEAQLKEFLLGLFKRKSIATKNLIDQTSELRGGGRSRGTVKKIVHDTLNLLISDGLIQRVGKGQYEKTPKRAAPPAPKAKITTDLRADVQRIDIDKEIAEAEKSFRSSEKKLEETLGTLERELRVLNREEAMLNEKLADIPKKRAELIRRKERLEVMQRTCKELMAPASEIKATA